MMLLSLCSAHLVSKALFYLKLFHVSHYLSIQEDCIQEKLDIRQKVIANSQSQRERALQVCRR